jgi:nucleotide-binding universal stress UspA family protein
MALIDRHYRLAASRCGNLARSAWRRCSGDLERIRSDTMVSTIAIGVDGSDTAARALDMGVEIARRFDAKIVLLSALRVSTTTASAGLATAGMATAGLSVDPVEVDWSYEKSVRVRSVLESIESRLRHTGLDCSTLVDEGDPGDVLVHLAEECGADLLVVGSKGMQRRMLGSVPNTVTHKAPCSVLVVKTT